MFEQQNLRFAFSKQKPTLRVSILEFRDKIVWVKRGGENLEWKSIGKAAWFNTGQGAGETENAE